MRVIGYFDVLSFVRRSWLRWIGHVNRTDLIIIIPREVDRDDDEKNRWRNCGIVYKQILVDAKLNLEKKGKSIADWEKSIQKAEVCIGL